MAHKQAFLSVRLSDEERAMLDRMCKASGLTASRVIRKLIDGARIKRSYAAEYKALYTEINRIGNNINQIARSVNAGIAKPEDAARAVFLLRQVYEKLEQVADK